METKADLFIRRKNEDQNKNSAPARPKKRLKRVDSAGSRRRSKHVPSEAPDQPVPSKTMIMEATAAPAPPSPSRDLDSSPPNAFASPASLGPTTSLVPAKFSRQSTVLAATTDEVKAKLDTTPSLSVRNSKSGIKSDNTVDALASTPNKNELPAESAQPPAESTQPPHAFLRVNIEPSFDELVDKTTVVSPPSYTRRTEEVSGTDFFDRVSLDKEDDSIAEGSIAEGSIAERDGEINCLLNDMSISCRSLEKIDVSSPDPTIDLKDMFGDSTLSKKDAPKNDSSNSPFNLELEPLPWDPRRLASAGNVVVTEQDIESVSTAELLKDTREFIKAVVDYNNPNECIIHEDGLTRSPLDTPALERYRIKNVLESHLEEEWWFEAESKVEDVVAEIELSRKNQLERLISLTAVMVKTSEWRRVSYARDKVKVFLVVSRLVELWGLVFNFMTLDSEAKARIPVVKNMCARIDWLCRRGCPDSEAEP